MNNIKISKICGLCAGCRFAIDSAIKCLNKNKQVCLFKEIVHNKNVMDSLIQKGLVIKNTLEELSPSDLVVIRAHGEPPDTFKYLETHGIEYVDCTCAKVKNIHKKVEEFSAKGFRIILIGKYGKTSGKIHPEVAGTMGYCIDPILIEDEQDIKKLNNIKNEKFYLICQTTFNERLANILVDKIKKVATNNNCQLEINFSICDVQKQMNLASCDLAEKSDIMIVVGSLNSSNTYELYNNLCHITNTIFLEKTANWKQELDKFNIKITKNTKIGITSGASTDPAELKNLKRHIENYLLENYMEINVNAHSSIQIGDIFIDPYLIKDESKKASYILLTHTHYDHLSLDDIKKIMTDKTVFVAPKDAAEILNKHFSKNKKIYVEPNQKIKFNKFFVETLPAYNINKQFHKREYNWLAYKLFINNISYLICGDSDATEELLAETADVLFVPIGGTYTMNALEASMLTNKISPNLVVPIHYNSIVGNKDDEKVFLENLDKNINFKIFC